MILGFKQKFANGEMTCFDALIVLGLKIHSIRAGYRWRKGMSIQMAHGVRTNHYQQFNKELPQLQTCMSVQDIAITHGSSLIITVNGKYLTKSEIKYLIKNDGLTRSEFIEWFVPNVGDQFCGQIIHWTDFNY